MSPAKWVIKYWQEGKFLPASALRQAYALARQILYHARGRQVLATLAAGLRVRLSYFFTIYLLALYLKKPHQPGRVIQVKAILNCLNSIFVMKSNIL
ncbi:hypothetical protein [Undibacterium sp.]|uniref:hypothetical protein n=1 Tax=Undibacterium sp. TaxID=1914977 RepID=UPI00374DE672